MIKVSGNTGFIRTFLDDDDLGGSHASGSSFNARDINSVVAYVQEMDNDETSLAQKAESTVDMITQSFTKLLSYFGKNEEAAAQKEMDNNTKAANAAHDKVEDITQKTGTEVDNLNDQVQMAQDEVEEQIDEIEDNQQEQEEIAQKIEEEKEKIEENAETANDSSATEEERKDAIENIHNSASEIEDLSGEISEISETIEDSNEEIGDLQAESESIEDDIENTIDEGTEEINLTIDEAVAGQAENAASSAEGTANESIAAAAETEAAAIEASAKASSFVPILGGALSASEEVMAQQLHGIAEDQGGAGRIRIGGSAANIRTLGAVIGLGQIGIVDFSNMFNYSLGVAEDFNNRANDFYSLYEPIGSWFANAQDIEDSASKIDEASQEEGKVFNYDTDELNMD